MMVGVVVAVLVLTVLLAWRLQVMPYRPMAYLTADSRPPASLVAAVAPDGQVVRSADLTPGRLYRVDWVARHGGIDRVPMPISFQRWPWYRGLWRRVTGPLRFTLAYRRIRRQVHRHG